MLVCKKIWELRWKKFTHESTVDCCPIKATEKHSDSLRKTRDTTWVSQNTAWIWHFFTKKVIIGNFLRKSMSLGARTAITLQKQPDSAASSLNSNNFGNKQTKLEIFEKNCGKMQWAIAKPWIHLRQFQRWKDYWSSWNHFSGWDSDGGCCQRWCFTWHGQNIRATKTS